MTPAQRAAARISEAHAFYPVADGSDVDHIADIICDEYAELDASVAELVKQSKLAATRLMRAYLDVRELNEAIGAVEGK